MKTTYTATRRIHSIMVMRLLAMGVMIRRSKLQIRAHMQVLYGEDGARNGFQLFSGDAVDTH